MIDQTRCRILTMTCYLRQLVCFQNPHRSLDSAAIETAQDESDRQIEQGDGQDEPPSHNISPFLHKLPLELRLLIYYHLFQGQLLHLVRTPDDKRPYFPRSCNYMNDHPLFPRQLEGPETPSSSVNISLVEYNRERRLRCALLLTCRQVYNESCHIFYGASTLRFDDPKILTGLARHYLPQRHLKALRRLEIVWNCHISYAAIYSNADHVEPRSEQSQLAWNDMWRLVVEEMNISSLKVSFGFFGAPWVPTVDDAWVQPLLKVQELSDCGVYIGPCGYGLGDGCLARGFGEGVRNLLRQNGNRMID